MNRAPLLLAVASLWLAAPLPATSQSGATTIDAQSTLSIGVNKGTLVQLDRAATNVFIANPKVADVQLKSPRLVYVFGTGEGETSFYAVDKDDRPIYAASIRVANNIDQIKQMLKMALPEGEVDVQTLNGIVFLSGTVASPQAVEQATALTQSFIGDKQTVVNQLRTATPVQVNLQVKIAEVSRDVLKQLGFNWATQEVNSGNFLFGLSRGRNFATFNNTPLQQITVTQQLAAQFPVLSPFIGTALQFDPATGLIGSPLGASLSRTLVNFTGIGDGTTSFYGSRRFGSLDVAGAVDAMEQEGLLTVLAEPNLTALSGESASFLAGGEFAIPAPDDNGRIVIQYKEYGVSLTFVPIVHSGSRISMRVKPEVSQLTNSGAITLNGITVPGLQTRRAETTVELGSGESFAIAGLLQNNISQDIVKTPGLGNLPVLGALFKSDKFRRQETELVIIVTPYLVKPVDAKKLSTPVDGFRAPHDANRLLLDQRYRTGKEPEKPEPAGRGGQPPLPTAAPQAPQPGFSFGQ
jgi:pilus assembly protein CpaC